MMVKVAGTAFSTFVLAIIACGPVSAADFELRGTLLCAPEGDRSRLRPIEREVVVVVPDLLPRAASLVRPDGVFTIRLPMTSLDQQLYLQAFNGPQSVGTVPVYLEPGRLRLSGRNGRVYVLPEAFALDRDCETLSSDPSTAKATLARFQAGQPELSQRPPVTTRRKIGGLGTLIAGALGILAIGGSSNAPVADLPPGGPVGDTLVVLRSRDAGIGPGQLPIYARHAASAALGRTLTTRRASGQLLSWNPAAVPGERAFGLGAGGDESGLLWGSANAPFPVGGMPSGLSFGIVHLGGERQVDLELENSTTSRINLDHDETLVMLGCGAEVHGGFSIGSDVQYFNQTLQKVEYAVVDTSAVGAPIQHVIHEEKKEDVDWDLSLLWDMTPRTRLSLAGHNLLDTKGLDADGRPTSLREVTLTGLWSHKRLELGAEASGSDDGLQGAFGLNVRPTNFLGIDAGVDSRFRALEAGVDVLYRGFRILVRSRHDDQEDFAVSCSLDWRR